MKNRIQLTTPEAFYDKHADDYDSEYSDMPFWKLYDDLTWDNILRYLPKNRNAKVLDAGGGTGRWTLEIARLGYNVVLTDISQKMLDIARVKVERENLEDRVTIMKQDIRNMEDLQDSNFDLIMAEGDPLGYCDSPKRAVEEFNRVLKPGRHAIASVDNRISGLRQHFTKGEFGRARELLRTGKTRFENPKVGMAFDIHAFYPEELRSLFQMSGFEVMRLFGKIPIPWIWIEKLVSSKKGYDEVLKAQIEFSDVEGLFPLSGHLGIVGKKINSKH